MKILALNKKAEFNYQIQKKYQAGIILKGHEVKSVKNGQISLLGSYGRIKKKEKGSSEIWLLNCFIGLYKQAGKIQDYNPLADRRLLLKKEEIKSLIGKLKEKNLTIIPLKVYTKNGLIKIELGLGKGRKRFDKRQVIKQREVQRRIQRELKNI